MKYVRAAITVPAGTATVPTTIQTPDDPSTRTLRVIWMTPQAGTQHTIDILRTGAFVSGFDSQRFAAGNQPVALREVFGGTINFQVVINNPSGGSITYAILIGYDVGDTSNMPGPHG